MKYLLKMNLIAHTATITKKKKKQNLKIVTQVTTQVTKVSVVAQTVKNPPAMWETWWV